MSKAPSEAGIRWTRFYLENRSSLIAYALALTHNADDAQDLIQDVLVRLVAEDRSVGCGRAYVMWSLRNLAIDRRRHAARSEQTALPVEAAAIIDTDVVEPERRETARRVHDALRRLSKNHREVIVLKTYCKLTLREIAETLDMPPGTVASHYRRGLEELRGMLAEAFEDVP